MNAITLDTPLLLGGLLWLLWLRFYAPAYRFQLACQFVGTIWAQYTFVLSWSLAKLVPILSATTWDSRHIRKASLFVPFVVYTIIGGLISSMFWKVPADVSYAYGEGRLWVQLATFLSLVLCTRAYAATFLNAETPLLMWKVVVSIGIIHGLAFLYQYFALVVGLPVIGISRAHGLTLNDAVGDVAAFNVGNIDILRPGGLAGEPKTVATLFGIVLVTLFACGNPIKNNKKWNLLYKLSLAFSGICFVASFSTSAYAGFFASIIGVILMGLVRLTTVVKGVFAALLLISVIQSVLFYADLPNLTDLFTMRFFDRIAELKMGGLDPPVEAAIQILITKPQILLFGTGIGGGTFYIQQYLGSSFEYTFTPNVGAIALLLEHGLSGTLLLLGPYFFLFNKVRLKILAGSFNPLWERKLLLSLSLSSMILMLSGSGIALGYPLAMGSLLAIYSAQRPKKSGGIR